MDSNTVRTTFAHRTDGYREVSRELVVHVDEGWVPRTKKGWSPREARRAEIMSWTTSLLATVTGVLWSAPPIAYGLLSAWAIFAGWFVPTLVEDVALSPRWRQPQVRVLQVDGPLHDVRIQADGHEYEVVATIDGKLERVAFCLSHAEALTLSAECSALHSTDRASLA